MRVLIVDDSLLIREVARAGLEMAGGFSVSTAESGRQGVAAAVADPPDVILLDVVMPDMDGPATVQALREREETRNVPVVLVTGRDQDEDRRAFAALGVAGVITKPFDTGTLAVEVRQLMGWG